MIGPDKNKIHFLELDSHWMRYETDILEIHENMRHSVAVLSYGG